MAEDCSAVWMQERVLHVPDWPKSRQGPGISCGCESRRVGGGGSQFCLFILELLLALRKVG